MRLYVVTPDGPARVIVDPHVQPGLHPCPSFSFGYDSPLELPPGKMWCVRLPYPFKMKITRHCIFVAPAKQSTLSVVCRTSFCLSICHTLLFLAPHAFFGTLVYACTMTCLSASLAVNGENNITIFYQWNFSKWQNTNDIVTFTLIGSNLDRKSEP